MNTGRSASSLLRALLLAFAFAWSALTAAQVPVPDLTGHIIDQTGTLNLEQKAALEQSLTSFEAKKGSQLAVLMVESTAPEEIEQFALRVAEKWKLGRMKVDDGAILVVAKSDRVMRIEVGYGLEGALNDATSKRIISETILPRFKNQDFYGGLTAGVDQIIRVIDGEPLPSVSQAPAEGLGGVGQYTPIFFILVLAVGGLLRAKLGKLIGALVTGGVIAVVAWFLVGTLFIALIAGVLGALFSLISGGMGGHGSGGYYGGGGMGGGRSGGGGFGGGGGFSGGGGGFGGGGASGRW